MSIHDLKVLAQIRITIGAAIGAHHNAVIPLLRNSINCPLNCRARLFKNHHLSRLTDETSNSHCNQKQQPHRNISLSLISQTQVVQAKDG